MEHVANKQDSVSYNVIRILSLSPEQIELSRRNYSRIFVTSNSDSVLDAVLFQVSRSMDSYIPSIARAIAEAGLRVNGDLQLRPNFDPKFGSGLFQQHIITNGWLQDEEGEAFDLFVELDLSNESVELPNMTTYDAVEIDGAEFENPLCFKVGIEDLSPQWDAMMEDSAIVQPRHEPEVDGDRVPGARGRVKDPETDRRLKENRSHPPQLVSARKTQDDGSGDRTQRMAGSPGRVRFPEIDGRLKRNRQPASEGAGGR